MFFLNSKKVKVDSDRAILVRTSNSPEKISLKFTDVPVQVSVCVRREEYWVPRTCNRTEYRNVREQRCETVTRPATTTPRGPRYNPGTGTPAQTTTSTICRDVIVSRPVVVSYSCPYLETRCVQTENRYGGTVTDSVKIKFKDMPALGGSEEETFSIKAEQNGVDNSNIIYTISPVKTVENRIYEVVKKGILGFDSYVIQPK